jgi:hypothetical protein
MRVEDFLDQQRYAVGALHDVGDELVEVDRRRAARRRGR